jgi:glycosyltransferase involved in cell wall biosynthesis
VRLAVVAPLPPARTGPAPYLAGMLPALAARAELTVCVPDVLAVDPVLRQRWDVRPLEDRYGDHDLVVYHVANNPWHAEVNAAAFDGPAGLVVLHDASQHHLALARTHLAGDTAGYLELMADGHGERGLALARLASMVRSGPLGLELFLYDLLAPLLSRHLGVQVHNRYAANLVRRRCPGLPVHVVPLRAPDPVEPADLTALGIPAGRTVLGHAGFVNGPKRYDVMCAATALLAAEGLDVHLLLAGEDFTRGGLDAQIARYGVQDRVTCTGWQSEEDFERTVAALDVGLSLRWPHVGESSATLAALLSYGVPVVAEPLGSWAEFPPDVVTPAWLGDDPAAGLADALRPLVRDPRLRAEHGARAVAFAREHLSTEHCATAFVAACEEVATHRLTPLQRRQRNEARKAVAVAEAPASVAGRLAQLPVAARGQRLVAVGAPAEVLAALPAWGYEVSQGSLAGLGTGDVDVVSAWEPVPLAEVNRVLAAGGTLHHDGLDVQPFGLSPSGPGLAVKTGPVLAPRPLLDLPRPA